MEEEEEHPPVVVLLEDLRGHLSRTSGNLANTSRAEFNNRSTFKLYFFTAHSTLPGSVSEHHLCSCSCLQLLSTTLEQSDFKRLKEKYTLCRISPANPTSKGPAQSGRHHLQLANGANDVLLFKASCIVVYRLPEGEGGGGIPLQWVSPCSSTTALVKELLYLFGSIFNERHLSADRLLFPQTQ
ncbi:Enhancer of polycomb like 2 [Dissostichus eleginoides]|uniref:Enhancer of polycomb like 2 n=1 Tax=Dissostichus eleginoides TaxID=100907 RepID=A0AAD9F2Y2_DISEL|nr:Enhancer of polycomb like 2 [Dissostichus eleginoides]